LDFRNVLRNKETEKNPSEDDHLFQLPQLVIEITEIMKETERDKPKQCVRERGGGRNKELRKRRR
jgi:hypothetical protein